MKWFGSPTLPSFPFLLVFLRFCLCSWNHKLPEIATTLHPYTKRSGWLAQAATPIAMCHGTATQHEPRNLIGCTPPFWKTMVPPLTGRRQACGPSLFQHPWNSRSWWESPWNAFSSSESICIHSSGATAPVAKFLQNMQLFICTHRSASKQNTVGAMPTSPGERTGLSNRNVWR